MATLSYVEMRLLGSSILAITFRYAELATANLKRSICDSIMG